jgi:hypothetical protein
MTKLPEWREKALGNMTLCNARSCKRPALQSIIMADTLVAQRAGGRCRRDLVD